MSARKVVKLHPESAQKEVASEQTFNVPNVLTFLRILMVPVYIALFLEPTVERSIAAAGVFGLAALTDLLDGHLARKRGEITKIGRLLDPIADKFLVISGLVLLVQVQRIDAWIAITLIVRDLAITGVRAVAASEGIIIAAGILGKYKVVLQIIAILLLTLQGALVLPFLDIHLLGTIAIYLALGFSLVSAGQYLIEAWQAFVQKGMFK